MAFIGGSELVLLDEPTAGMDPHSRFIVKKFVERKKKTRQGSPIILTTHYLDEAEVMGDWMYIMYMGRSICSGSPYFLKSKFAPGIILSVVFAQNASKKSVESTKKIIAEQIEGVKTGVMTGAQLHFEIPKAKQERIPKLFASLESEQQKLQIDSFGLSLNALEEAFLKIADITETKREKKPTTFIQNPRYAELHEG
ncbi:unnamed protein product [Strongylus vulgaris]|uniref:ABC transporter domain-containing protein n=1 Tax=Strongylus vulgaris TaxID=40348 RepID=A0A3P7IXB7_STRVU|nr:unnamed protein product [Strongylus vulgaris]